MPHAPGTSPFQIKGEFYRQTALSMRHHDEKSGGEVRRILAREGLLEFFEIPFLSSVLYDALPLPRLVMAIAEARNRDVRELTLRMGRAAVDAQLVGVYGNLLRAITPENFCGRFEQLIRQFYNFGPITATPVAGGARVVREGMPLCIAEWWSLVTRAFAETPLTAQGATEFTLEWRVTPTVVDRGVPCGTILWDVRWKMPSAAS